MKIGINLSFIKTTTNFGIGSYITNILLSLQELDLLDSYYLIIQESFHPYAKDLFPAANLLLLDEKKWMRKTGRLSNFLIAHDFDMVQVPRFAKQEALDLMFYPFHAVSNKMNLNIPVVTTIHDLFHCNYPEYLSKKYLTYVRYRYNPLIYKSDHLIAISDFVKDDIQKHFPKVTKSKIHRIHNSIVFDEALLEAVDIDKPYILCVNSMRYHKNYLTLVKAFHTIHHEIPHMLVLVGGQGEASREIQQYVQHHQLQDRVICLSELSDGQRNYLYRHADLFVSPSLHEGFGMTPVEAMLAATPVITTKETSLYEVTQGLANYYEPARDACQLANKMLEVLQNPEPQECLRNKALQLKEAYDPIKIALEYDRFLKGIVYENRN